MRFGNIGLCVLSGLLLTAGFPSLGLHWVSWFALVPLFFALRHAGARESFLRGLLCGFVHFITALYWVWYVLQYYGGFSFGMAAFVVVLMCVYLGLYIALFTWLAYGVTRRPLLWVFAVPCLWVAVEYLRTYALTGFPWAFMGYTQTPVLTLAQIADVTGVYGMSWLVVLANTGIFALLALPRLRVLVVVPCILVALTVFYGNTRLGEIELAEREAPAFPVGVVQGNIDQSVKWDPAFQEETLRRYETLSKQAVSGTPVPRLLVWPETSAPFYFGLDEKRTPQLVELVRQLKTGLLFGAPGAELTGGKPKLFNRAYVLTANGVLVGSYAKRHLVPFGEYVPLQNLFFFMHRLVQSAGDFTAGTDAAPLPCEGEFCGILVCYEGIFPELSRDAVRLGATLLVNITNDAWYGPTSAPYQHLEMARWRAIEFRRPLVRAANTGISAIVDARGAMLGSIPLNQTGTFVADTHPLRIQTFYAKWGDLFAWICVAFGLAALVGARFGRDRRFGSSPHGRLVR